MAVAEKGHRTCFVDRINMLKKFVSDNCSGVSVDSDEAAVRPLFVSSVAENTAVAVQLLARLTSSEWALGT